MNLVPRRGSVMDRVLARRELALWLLLPAPALLLATTSASRRGGPIAPGVLALGIGLLWSADIVAMCRAFHAASRMRKGLPPTGAGVDYGIGPDEWWMTIPPDSPYRSAARVELVARGSPSHVAHLVLRRLLLRAAVVAGLFGIGHACASGPPCRGNQFGTARAAMTCLRAATILFQNEHPGLCPTLVALKRTRFLDRGFPATDPWANKYEIVCAGDDITVRTDGPDRKSGTADDLVVPQPAPAITPHLPGTTEHSVSISPVDAASH